MVGPVIFFGAFALLGGFFWLRAMEMKSGIRFFEAFRARLDKSVLLAVDLLMHARIPDEHKRALKHAVITTAHTSIMTLAGFVRNLERRLVRAGEHIIRRLPRSPRSGGSSPNSPSSPFLGAVVEHKNTLKRSLRKMAERMRSSFRDKRGEGRE